MAERLGRRKPLKSRTRGTVPLSPSAGFSFAPASNPRDSGSRQGNRPARCTDNPWTPADVERLLTSARAMPGTIGDVRADHWWAALLIAELDTGAAPRNLLAAPFSAFDRGRGMLRAGCFVYGLHPLSIEALEALVFRREPRRLLFEWHRDYSQLFPSMKNLVYRAGLPPVTGNLFERLRVTCWRDPEILNRIDPCATCELRTGSVRIPKARDARVERGKKRMGAIPAHRRLPDLVLIGSDSPRTLRNFLRDVYAPRRLMDCGPRGAESHTRSINGLCAFSACEVTLDQLSDELMEEYAVWLRKSGRSPATINTHIAPLLALWRYAFKKRKLDHVPRDVEKLRVPKRLPEAWSPDEVGRILAAAAEETG
jgi:hypothetical protein